MRSKCDHSKPYWSNITDKDVIRDLNLKDVKTCDIKIIGAKVCKLYDNHQILQNFDDPNCKQLFAVIMVDYPYIGRLLFHSNNNLFNMIQTSKKQINEIMVKITYGHVSPYVNWYLAIGVIDICHYLSMIADGVIIYPYMFNDGQILKYIEFVKNYIDSVIGDSQEDTGREMTYEMCKKLIIMSNVMDNTNSNTISPSILLQDIEKYANKLIKIGNLTEFKNLDIVMPDNDDIGIWRNTIPSFAKTYFIYKIGTEILTGSQSLSEFVTINFKLILWIWHIIFNHHSCSLLILPNEILFEIIKLLSCKIGANRDKPISRGIYCLNYT